MEILVLIAIIGMLLVLAAEFRKHNRKAVKRSPSRKLSRDKIIQLIKQEVEPISRTRKNSTSFDELETHFYNLKAAYENHVTCSLSGTKYLQIKGQKIKVTAEMRERCLFASRKLRNETIRDYGVDLAKLVLAKAK